MSYNLKIDWVIIPFFSLTESFAERKGKYS
jgi:hypothetical protein